ncbi:hypothetical protein EVAR_68412_1 [Eumeta japonica]|uniref:Uncharacterized protein n=1 Tax=Eumeta variegata TaxID=151549 RepID=A0A4C2A2M5_EUMVA|nr:hypothetical protein EVAR_68412_1 [Eumeta japonica]
MFPSFPTDDSSILFIHCYLAALHYRESRNHGKRFHDLPQQRPARAAALVSAFVWISPPLKYRAVDVALCHWLTHIRVTARTRHLVLYEIGIAHIGTT